MGLTCAVALLAAVAGEDVWPPREWLLKSLTEAVPGILASQDPDTGRFGTAPWICSDQNVLLPLAAAWAIESPGNPYFHDAGLLTAIAKGGEALVDDQDERGMWIFRKKDGSTWGQIHMPWTYSRWIRAYALVREALPPETREKWERGLRLGFNGIRKYMDGAVHNIPCHHAMALAIAAHVFGEAEWAEAAKAFIARVVAAQDPAGFWSEHYGPVVGYNEVYVDALGVYYAVTADETVLPALDRSARFHAAMLWPDGSPVAAIDERQIYHAGRDYGNVGFSHTPAGRGYLLAQTAPLREQNRPINADYAAAMLLYSGAGEAVPPTAQQDRGRFVLGDGGALVERRRPWQWCFSAYACQPTRSRWIQDRHNLVDVFHDALGLVVGGGNTKLQPYWSTFTVGDPTLLSHRPGDENPEFLPAIDLLWYPTRATLALDDPPTLALEYGDLAAQVTATPLPDGALRLTYRAQAPEGRRVEAHVPLLWRPGRVRCGSGRILLLDESEISLEAAELGGHLSWSGLGVDLPPSAALRWPARQHNPYTKDGSAPLSTAKLVLILPLSATEPEQSVVLRHEPAPAWDGLAYDARDLPVESPTGTRTKRLDDLGSLFLGATADGDSMTFTLPPVAAGRYELAAEFVLASSYGIVRVLLDGRPVGEPFDAFCPGVDAAGERVSFGVVELTAGRHRVSVEVVGKRDAATARYISVKRWLLRPAPPGG